MHSQGAFPMVEWTKWWREQCAPALKTFLLIALVLVITSWFVLPWFAEQRKYRALGYTGDTMNFNQTFLAPRVRDGDPPSRAFDVLRHGSRVSYYLQTQSDGEQYLVQRFDFSIIWGGPDIYVIYPTSPEMKKVITTKFTDSFSTSRSERIADSVAYRILNWRPAVQ
jgi:hypothetical protein